MYMYMYTHPHTACNLVYLGSVDLPDPGDEQTVAYSVEQLRSMDSLSMNIVTFKASRDGVTLTDNINGWVAC